MNGPYQLLPNLSDEEYVSLRADIAANGVRVPVELDEDGAILDGHHRVRIAVELGIDYPHRVVSGLTEEQKRSHALAVNVNRRTLGRDQRRDLVRASLRADPGLSDRQHAERTGVSHPTVATIRSEMETAGELEKLTSRKSADGRTRPASQSPRDTAPEPEVCMPSDDGSDNWSEPFNDDEPFAFPDPSPDPLPAPIANEIDRRIEQKRTTPRPEPVMLQLRDHTGKEWPYPKPAGKATFNETTGEGISWAAWSWNPVTGCLHGCDYCYARAIAARFTDAYPAGFTPLFHDERLEAPANTVIPAAHRDDPAYRRVFVCSMADLYGRWVSDDWIQCVHASMLASPQWQYILLTKFPSRYIGLELPAGAWVGTSVDEQKRVRIAQDAMAKLDGVTRWLSLEPLREPLEFDDLSMFDWVVIGAQTETRQPTGTVRAVAPDFEVVAQLVAQARAAGCRVHLKPNLVNGRPGMALPDEYPA